MEMHFSSLAAGVAHGSTEVFRHSSVTSSSGPGRSANNMLATDALLFKSVRVRTRMRKYPNLCGNEMPFCDFSTSTADFWNEVCVTEASAICTRPSFDEGLKV